jgi:hypothetical protein
MKKVNVHSCGLLALSYLLESIEGGSGILWDYQKMFDLIHKYGIEFKIETDRKDRLAVVFAFPACTGGVWASGQSHIIAAALCIVMSKLGTTAEVPDELA